MAQEGDIVFMIGADVAGLTSAGQAGEKSLAEMERAAKTLERQIGKIGEAGVTFQREMNKLTGVTSEFSKSARDSAAAFEAFDKARAQVDNLRASIDPLFAASKRYEAALSQLDGALEMGAISAKQHAAMMDQVAAAYLRADGAADTMGRGFGFLGGMSSQTQGKLQQMGFQIQDFAVQVGAGTSATQAFAQQFPQMAGAFGPWGVAIGTAAAILVPLGAAFLSASENADKLTEAADRQKQVLDALTEAAKRLRLERQMEVSGAQFTEEQEALNRIAELTAQRADIQQRLNSLLDIGSRAAGYADQVRDKRAILQAELDSIDAKIEALNKERALTAATQASKAVADQMRILMGQLAGADISAPWQSVLSWITQAADKAREYASLAAYGAELASTGQSSGPDAARSKVQFGGGVFTPPVQGAGGAYTPPSGAGGGGGGGGTSQIQTQLEALRQQLMTEEQIEMESYAKRQEMLQQALDQRLLTQQEYAALMEQAQQQHTDKMGDIDAYRFGSTLDKAGAFFGDMASAMQGGNEQMLKISKAFGAAQALISAWQGAAEALKLPFPQNIAAFAKVLATGMGAVNAIKGAGKGGTTSGTGASAGSAAAVQAAPVQTMNFTVSNDPFGFGERIVRDLVSKINEAQRNGSSIRATYGAA